MFARQCSIWRLKLSSVGYLRWRVQRRLGQTQLHFLRRDEENKQGRLQQTMLAELPRTEERFNVGI